MDGRVGKVYGSKAEPKKRDFFDRCFTGLDAGLLSDCIDQSRAEIFLGMRHRHHVTAITVSENLVAAFDPIEYPSRRRAFFDEVAAVRRPEHTHRYTWLQAL